jgi:hypothetical protein
MFSYFLSTTALQGQILKDTASINLLKRCVDDIYNFQFDNARLISQKLNQSLSGQAVVYLLNGMITYWENYPLIPSSPASASYENDMRNCIRLCEEIHNPDDYPEYLLTNLGARGMLLMYYADNNLTEEVFPLAKSTYRYLRQSFDYSFFYSDFYFFTGLYNYYREAYPDAHPIYKVLAMFFPKGDRVKGIAEMKTAAQNSIILKAESFSFLTYIYISFENNYQDAYVYSKSLYELYPANLQYLVVYIKNMLLLKKYDEAENLIRLFDNITGNSFFQAAITIFHGILQEKKYHNNELAHKYYNKGISDISVFGYYGNEYAAYAYFGLSRLFDSEDNKHKKRMYRKKALELTDYKKVNFDE